MLTRATLGRRYEGVVKGLRAERQCSSRTKRLDSDGMKNGAPLLFYGDSYRFPDIYHTIRFLAPDPQIVLEHDGEIVMLTNSLEQGRAQKQSRATKIHNIDEFGSRELVAGGMKPALATATAIHRFPPPPGPTQVTAPPPFPPRLAPPLP